jgi:ribonuclease Z
MHATAREAARVAREAEVGRLVLTHLSTRYDRDTGPLLEQARSEFERVEVASDGLVIEVPLPP